MKKSTVPTGTRGFLDGMLMLLPALCVLFIGTAYPEQTPAVVTRPVKIGAIYNLSGAQASLDQPSLRGARLAVKQLNTSGDALGRQIELIVYNGKTDPAVIRERTETLMNSDHVAAVIGLSDTDMVLAAAPLAAQAHRVFLTSGATSPQLPKQVPAYLFLACFGDNAQAAAGAEYAYETLQARTAYTLFDSDMDYTLLLRRYFTTRFVELGGTIVGEERYQKQPLRLSPQIDKLKALEPQPDMVYLAAGPDEVGTIVKQLREAQVTIPIVGGDSYDTPLLLRTAGESANNTHYTTHALLNDGSSNQRVREFIAAYKAAFGVMPESAFAALGYDAILLLTDAIKRAGSDDPQKIGHALRQTKGLHGVTGTISFTHDSHIPQKTVTIVQVKDQRPTLAAEIIPKHVPMP